MNNKLIATTTFAALAVGGLSAGSIASAQSYASGVDTAEQTTDVSTTDATAPADLTAQGSILNVQATDDDTADGDTADGDSADRAHRGNGGGCNLDDAAAAIGIEESALRDALDGGQSIAEVAEANGVDAQDVIDAMVTAKADQLAEKVEEGRLTQAEADEKAADLESRITDQVNGAEDASQS